MTVQEFMRRLAIKVADLFPVRDGETLNEYADRARQGSFGRRALVAAALDSVSKSFRQERQARKSAWIASARLSFSPGNRHACQVCGKFSSITQAHHVVPLSAQFERGYLKPDHEHEWLCPNHHAIIHLMLPPEGDDVDPAALGRRAASPILDLVDTELDRTLGLIARSGRAR